MDKVPLKGSLTEDISGSVFPIISVFISDISFYFIV